MILVLNGSPRLSGNTISVPVMATAAEDGDGGLPALKKASDAGKDVH